MRMARFGLPLFFCLTAFTWPAAAANEGTTFTLRQVLSAPFPTDLIAAHANNRFAWVFNAQGKRNVWIAEPGPARNGYTARPITKYAEDDGQDIGELVFTPDAELVIYTRGGDLETGEKSYPNPSQLVGGTEQDLWSVPVNGGEPRRLGEGHSAAVSPKGDVIAYILKGQFWVTKLDGSEKPQQLLHTRAESSALRWSPDGRFLAFVTDREDHAFIAVYSFKSKTLSYPDPGTDKDAEPVWSPDSHRLAFLRIPYSKNDLFFMPMQAAMPFMPMRTGPPWSIRVIDVDTGRGGEIWKASEGRGSVYSPVTADNQLLWAAGNKIIFPWERDGWTHLYSVSSQGGTPILLTPGAFEVEDVSFTPDLQSVVYSSNQDDIDRRHIWRVAVAGGQPSALTSGTGIETAGVTSSDGKVVATLRSDARLPMRPAIITAGKDAHDLVPDALPADFPAAQMVTPQQVVFPAADGMMIHAQLFLPASSGSARHPAVIFFHGGPTRQMLLGWHWFVDCTNAYWMDEYRCS